MYVHVASCSDCHHFRLCLSAGRDFAGDLVVDSGFSNRIQLPSENVKIVIVRLHTFFTNIDCLYIIHYAFALTTRSFQGVSMKRIVDYVRSHSIHPPHSPLLSSPLLSSPLLPPLCTVIPLIIVVSICRFGFRSFSATLPVKLNWLGPTYPYSECPRAAFSEFCEVAREALSFSTIERTYIETSGSSSCVTVTVLIVVTVDEAGRNLPTCLTKPCLKSRIFCS